jgi:hypothetical protein
VAVIGFHAPINATGRRESKFRLGVMTLVKIKKQAKFSVIHIHIAVEFVCDAVNAG